MKPSKGGEIDAQVPYALPALYTVGVGDRGLRDHAQLTRKYRTVHRIKTSSNQRYIAAVTEHAQDQERNIFHEDPINQDRQEIVAEEADGASAQARDAPARTGEVSDAGLHRLLPSLLIEKTNEYGTNRHDVGAVRNRTFGNTQRCAVRNRTYVLCHLSLSSL
jgi:hypothetical protein